MTIWVPLPYWSETQWKLAWSHQVLSFISKSAFLGLPGNNCSTQRGLTQRDQRWAFPFQAETKKSLEKKSRMEWPEKWGVLEGTFKGFVFSRKKNSTILFPLSLQVNTNTLYSENKIVSS